MIRTLSFIAAATGLLSLSFVGCSVADRNVETSYLPQGELIAMGSFSPDNNSSWLTPIVGFSPVAINTDDHDNSSSVTFTPSGTMIVSGSFSQLTHAPILGYVAQDASPTSSEISSAPKPDTSVSKFSPQGTVTFSGKFSPPKNQPLLPVLGFAPSAVDFAVAELGNE